MLDVQSPGIGEMTREAQSSCSRISAMKTLEVRVPDDVAFRIEEAAKQRGVSVEQLLRASVEEKIQRDAQFEQAVSRVLEKNAELYRRLS